MERNFSFLDYEAEIRQIARANNVDLGVAYDMFRADVRNGANINCGPCMDGFDFAGAKVIWDSMTKSEQSAAYEEWHDR